MTPTQTTGLSFTANNQSSIKTAVDNAISGLAVAGISGWRLPTLEEMEFLTEIATDVNANLRYLSMTLLSLGDSADYFFTKSDGTISSYKIGSGRELSYQDNKTIVRAVTTLTFKND